MSIQGKGNLSYKKQNVQKQNAPHTGVKTITFAHLFADAGDTFIPFDALVTPPDWSTSGLANPTTQSLLSAQLQVFKNNVTVTSSARGLIQKSEYIVHANRIEFKNITSLVNEAFEVEVADILITGNLIVDMQTIRVEGELQNDDTDFNMGYEFDILSEEIIVFREGIQMFRSDNNDSSGATGNYYYVDNQGSGKSSLIRFFEPSVGVEPILVASTGGVVDSPNVSTFQQIQSLQGQLDAVIPTVAALAGVPESNFRAGPNNVDLKTFGDQLITNKNDIADHETRITDLESNLDVFASYGLTNAFNVPTGAPVTLDLNVQLEDTYGIVDTTPGAWSFTIPSGKGGLYQISMANRVQDSGIGFTSCIFMYLRKDSIAVGDVILETTNSWYQTQPYPSVSATKTVRLNAGETYYLVIVQNSGSPRPLTQGVGYTYLTIKGVGN